MSVKIERIASNLQVELSDVIANEMKDDNIKFVTITAFKLAPDLSYAKVYFTTLNDEKKDEITEILNNAKGYIKNQLFKRKLKIRRIPDLEFVYDDSVAYGYNIDNIIKKLHEEK